MNTNNRQIVYIHGLNSSANSKKFKSILKVYPSAICIEWKTDDNNVWRVSDFDGDL